MIAFYSALVAFGIFPNVSVGDLGSDRFEVRELASNRLAAALPLSLPVAFLATASADPEVARRGDVLLKAAGLPGWGETRNAIDFAPIVFGDFADHDGLPWCPLQYHRLLGNDDEMRWRFAQWVARNGLAPPGVIWGFDDHRARLEGFQVCPMKDYCLGLDNLRFMVRGIDDWRYFRDIEAMRAQWATIKARGW